MRKPILLYLLRRGGASFSPPNVSGLWGWWDLSDLTTLFTTSVGSTPVAADGDLVGRAEDKSGNGRNLTVADANRPTWKVNIQNGRGATLHGVGGANKFLATAVNLPNANFSAAIVLKAPGTITGGTAYGSSTTFNSGTTDGTRLFFIDTDGVFKSQTAPTNATITDLAAVASTAYVATLSIQNTATQRVMQFNGRTPVTSGTAVTSADNVFRIGTHSTNNNTNFWTGHICEVVLYSPVISSSDMNLVRNYLNTKWGVY